MLHAAYGKKFFFLQTSGTGGKRILQPARCQQPQIGNHKPEKMGPGNSFHLSCFLFDFKIAELNGEVTFHIRAKWRQPLSPEHYMHGRLRTKRKRLLPEKCFCGMAVSNWRSSSLQISLVCSCIFQGVDPGVGGLDPWNYVVWVRVCSDHVLSFKTVVG